MRFAASLLAHVRVVASQVGGAVMIVNRTR
jgi:hypothetical protein